MLNKNNLFIFLNESDFEQIYINQKDYINVPYQEDILIDTSVINESIDDESDDYFWGVGICPNEEWAKMLANNYLEKNSHLIQNLTQFDEINDGFLEIIFEKDFLINDAITFTHTSVYILQIKNNLKHIYKNNFIFSKIKSIRKCLPLQVNASLSSFIFTYLSIFEKNQIFFKKSFFKDIKIKMSPFKDKKKVNNVSIKKLINKFKKLNLLRIKKNINKESNPQLKVFFLPKIKDIFKKKKNNFKKSTFKKKKKVFRYNTMISKKLNYNFIDEKPAFFNYFMLKLANFKYYCDNTNTIKFKLLYSFITVKNFFFNEKSLFFWKNKNKTRINLHFVKLDLKKHEINSLNILDYNLILKKNFIIKKQTKISSEKLYNFTSHLVSIKNTPNFYKSNFTYSFSNVWDNLFLDSYIGEFKKDIKFFKKNFFYNNYFPVYSVNKIKKLHIIKMIDLKKIPIYSNFYFYYMIFFLETFLGSKVWLKLNTKSLITEDYKVLFKKLVYKNKYEQIQFGKSLYLIELYEILFLALKNRDLTLFLIWFKKIMEKNDLRKHKKLVKIIHNTLRKNLYFLTLTNTAGIFFDIRGKLGVSGNAKKRHYAFTVGERSFTKKSLKLIFSQTTVRTDTGVLGISMYISY